jgi:hypothetical protein
MKIINKERVMAQQHPSSEEMTLRDLIAQSYLKQGQEAFFHPIEDIIEAVYQASLKALREVDKDDGK